jgi:diguanylate cyclase (GGDEF)-like protein
MLDVDEFGSFNNTYGHAAGDTVLQRVASTIQASVRDRDIVGRYGGEEFTVLLPRTTLAEGAVVAERIRKNVAALPPLMDIPVSPTVSIGVAPLIQGESLSEGTKSADIALYAAKNAGRNRVIRFDQLNT